MNETKHDLVTRLIKEDKITLAEALVLMDIGYLLEDKRLNPFGLPDTIKPLPKMKIIDWTWRPELAPSYLNWPSTTSVKTILSNDLVTHGSFETNINNCPGVTSFTGKNIPDMLTAN